MDKTQTKNGLYPPLSIQDKCRSCHSGKLSTVLSFGDTPIADRLVKREDLDFPEFLAPLTLSLCTDCGLVQILETVSPSVLFSEEYPYYSSVSPALMKHFASSAQNLIDEFSLDADSLVIEAASNDGYMLRNFHQKGIPVLGIDPAIGPANSARKIGIPTLNTFFTGQLAQELVNDNQEADIFLANNVLAHVPDLNGFVEGITTLLKLDGIAVIEFPYLMDLVERCEFDTIYHQHLCYFSVTSIVPLFKRHGLTINKIEKTDIHGGSLRIYASRNKEIDQSVRDLLIVEKEKNIKSITYFQEFERQISTIKTQFQEILRTAKKNGSRIIGYGAAAKATTLLHTLGVGKDVLECILDKNPHKDGLFMPGTNIPIKSPDKLGSVKPDYILILAWNFSREIIAENQNFVDQGGKFIVPIPEPKIISDPSYAIYL